MLTHVKPCEHMLTHVESMLTLGNKCYHMLTHWHMLTTC